MQCGCVPCSKQRKSSEKTEGASCTSTSRSERSGKQQSAEKETLYTHKDVYCFQHLLKKKGILRTEKTQQESLACCRRDWMASDVHRQRRRNQQQQQQESVCALNPNDDNLQKIEKSTISQVGRIQDNITETLIGQFSIIIIVLVIIGRE